MKTIITMSTKALAQQTGLNPSDMSPEHAAALLLDAHAAATKKPAVVHINMIPVDEWRAAFVASNGKRYVVHGNKVKVSVSVA